MPELPVVISAPAPRSLDLIFRPDARAALQGGYDVVEADPTTIPAFDDRILAKTRYIIGQPPLSRDTLQRMGSLRAIFNVESNLIDNMPYEMLFERGIHVLTTGAVFAEPVAELGLALALDLARDVVDADLAFRSGYELWGGDGNRQARLMSGSDIGIVGFGAIGRALHLPLTDPGFRQRMEAKASFRRQLGEVPVALVNRNDLELLGAAAALGNA